MQVLPCSTVRILQAMDKLEQLAKAGCLNIAGLGVDPTYFVRQTPRQRNPARRQRSMEAHGGLLPVQELDGMSEAQVKDVIAAAEAEAKAEALAVEEERQRVEDALEQGLAALLHRFHLLVPLIHNAVLLFMQRPV